MTVVQQLVLCSWSIEGIQEPVWPTKQSKLVALARRILLRYKAPLHPQFANSSLHYICVPCKETKGNLHAWLTAAPAGALVVQGFPTVQIPPPLLHHILSHRIGQALGLEPFGLGSIISSSRIATLLYHITCDSIYRLGSTFDCKQPKLFS